MKLDRSTVERLAVLARLEFSEQEKEELLADLNNILTFVDKLNGADTGKLSPMSYVSVEPGTMRADEVHPSITRAEALQNAPVAGPDYFKVPKVLRQNGGGHGKETGPTHE